MNLATIRSTLADALGTVFVSVAEYRTKPLDGFPGAIIEFDTVTPSVFGDGALEVDCTIRVLVSQAEDPEAWATIDELLSSNTISDALLDSGLQVEIGSYSNIGAAIEYDDGVALGFTMAVRVTS